MGESVEELHPFTKISRCGLIDLAVLLSGIGLYTTKPVLSINLFIQRGKGHTGQKNIARTLRRPEGE